MTEPLLSVSNKHSVSCGEPPVVTCADPNVYLGYFENPYGEQWIFTYDRSKRSAILRGGDVGWDKQYVVTEGLVPDLVLGPEELQWLAACWRAAVRVMN